MVDEVLSGDEQDEPFLPAQHWEAALGQASHQVPQVIEVIGSVGARPANTTRATFQERFGPLTMPFAGSPPALAASRSASGTRCSFCATLTCGPDASVVSFSTTPPDRQGPRDVRHRLRRSPAGAATATADARLVWIGEDDRGIELEIVALDLDGAVVVIHVMPTAIRRP